MQRTLEIILTFVNNATPGMQAAAKNLQAMMAGLGSATASTTSAMSNAWAATGGRIVGALGRIIDQSKLASAFVGGALTMMVAEGAKAAANFEQFGKSAVFLTGSADAAKTFAHSVKAVALETMFTVDQIAKMEIQLVGQTKNVKASEAALRVLTDAVIATKGGYSELEGVTRAYIQVGTKAYLSAEELNRQFTNNNIPVLRLLAESIEKDANHPLRKYIQTASGSGGAVGASKQLTNAFQKASDQLPILAKQSEAAEKSLQALKEKGKEGTAQFLRAEASVMSYHQKLDKAQGSIGAYTAAQGKSTVATKQAKLSLQEITAALADIGELKIPGLEGQAAIMRALQEAYGGAGKALENTFNFQLGKLQDNLVFVNNALFGINDEFGTTQGSIIKLVTSALIPLNNWLEKNGDSILKSFGRFVESVPGISTLAGILIGVLYPAIVGILGPMILLGTVFGGMGFLIGRLVEMNGGWAKTWVDMNNIFSTVIGFIQTTILPVLMQMVNTLGPIFIDAMNQLLPALGQLGAALAPLAPIIGGLLLVLLSLITGLVSGLAQSLAGVVTMITGAVNVIVGIFTMFFGLIVGLFTGNWTMLSDGWWKFLEGIKGLINGFIATVLGFVWGFVVGFLGFWHALGLGLHQKTSEIGKNTVKGFLDMKNTVIGVVQDIVSGIISLFGAIAPLAFGWGKGIIENFVKGIKDAAKAFGAAGSKIMSAAGFGDLKFQHGGIVPGALGQPVPIIAHGGERITPISGAGSNGLGGGSASINFYGNMTVDSPERVNELAIEIGKILGRQNELARYGAGY